MHILFRKSFWLQCVLISAVYLPFLRKAYFPLTWDQRLYISTILEMFESGNWLQPRLLERGSYYKPPLQYWATLVSWKLFGISFFSTLLPSFLAAVATCFLIEKIAVKLLCLEKEKTDEEKTFHLRSATLSPLCFFSSLGTFVFATSAQMEIYLCLFYAAGWWAALNYLSKGSLHWLYLSFAIAGISSWVKSPLYSALWIASFVLYLGFQKKLDVFKSKHFYFALLGGVAIGLTWYVYIFQIDSQNFWNQYILQETLNKKNGSGHGPLFPWIGLLFWTIPWTLFVPSALIRAWNSNTSVLSPTLIHWFWAWVIPPAIFFTLHPFRMDPYLYLFFPAIALLVDQVWRNSDPLPWHQIASYRLSSILLSVFGLVIGLALKNSGLIAPWIWIGFLALAGFVISLLFFRPQVQLYLVGALSTIFLLAATVESLGIHDLNGLLEFRKAHSDRPIAILDLEHNPYHEVGWLSVAVSTPIRRVHSISEAADFVEKGGALLVPPHGADQNHALLQNEMASHLPIAPALQEVTWLRLGGKGGIRPRELLTFAVPSLSLQSRFFEKGQILFLKN